MAQVFTDFDPRPLATGSIGQAHVATLTDGTEVVVDLAGAELQEADLQGAILLGTDL